MNVRFDADYIMNEVYKYIYSEEIAGRDSEVLQIVTMLVEDELQDLYADNKRPVHTALKGFQNDFDDDFPADAKRMRSEYKKKSKEDVAYIAAKFGFLFGLVTAERERLKFRVEDNERAI